MGFASIAEAIEEIREGRIIIVVDDEERENEGDLTLAAEKVTPESINFMARYGRGLICLAMTPERLDQLHLPLMVEGNTNQYGTAFTVSIEARSGVTTGISAADRATTILRAIHSKTVPSDLVRPGHVFPLRARPGGVLERAGQTEAAVDLARLAGLYPAGVICEVMNDDGTMARVPELREVARVHGLTMVTVADIIAFRLRNETFVHQVAESPLRTAFGDFRLAVFENSIDHENHLAVIKGAIRSDEPTLVRVQSQSTVGDVFHAWRCESGAHLRAALQAIEQAGVGVLVYLRLEGKGASLANEVRGYALADGGESRELPDPTLDPRADLRTYGVGAQILRQLGVRKLRLLTNHPRKIVGLHGYGLTIVDQVPLEVDTAPEVL